MSQLEDHDSRRSISKHRIVIIGDAHCCLDSLRRLLISADHVDGRDTWIGANDVLNLLGDMVNEGAESYQVVRLARSLQRTAPHQVRVLMGNHEIMLLGGKIGHESYLNFETAWSFAHRDRRLFDAL